MKAVLLVGGEGTRLRPLTCNTPKAMVPVLNRPFLEHVLCHLKNNDVDTVILALGHLFKGVVEYFGDGSKVGIRVIYSVEDQPLGTAGPVKLAARHLDGRFLVLNGDIFSPFDLKNMVRYHTHLGSTATIALTPVENPSAYGVVEMDAQNRVQRFVEKPKPGEARSNMINAGTYVLEPKVLDLIPEQSKVMFEHNVFPTLLSSREPVFGYDTHGYWIDIGTPEKYLQLNLDLLNRQAEAKSTIGKGTVIHRTAHITGPVVIGDNCEVGSGVRLVGPVVLGADCRVGAGSILRETVIWPNSCIGDSCSVQGSVIADNSRLGDRVRAEGRCFISDHVEIDSGVCLDPGARLWPGTHQQSQ
ncbi:MAG: NDP-sugar synthase [Chloroflexi bacterium]|nr:NDP-sugar synthase [Chloroflexota bacterium]